MTDKIQECDVEPLCFIVAKNACSCYYLFIEFLGCWEISIIYF